MLFGNIYGQLKPFINIKIYSDGSKELRDIIDNKNIQDSTYFNNELSSSEQSDSYSESSETSETSDTISEASLNIEEKEQKKSDIKIVNFSSHISKTKPKKPVFF